MAALDVSAAIPRYLVSFKPILRHSLGRLLPSLTRLQAASNQGPLTRLLPDHALPSGQPAQVARSHSVQGGRKHKD
jgi:hypothetical protein